MIKISFLFFLIFKNYIQTIFAHGMVLDPVNRASRWRYNSSAPIDYNDNQGFCGGFYTQWFIQDGKCGLCGDNNGLSKPRPHEHGGKYGNGIVTKTYAAGDLMPVGVLITANHLGYFLFDLCNMDDSNETDACFDQYNLNLTTGESRYVVQTTFRGWFNTTLVISKNLSCNHCVLRWTYVTGNSWGTCENGTEAVGCGRQEHFRSCSDIRILSSDKVEDAPEEINPEE